MGLPVVGLWLTSELALGAVFAGGGAATQFAQAAMTFLLIWRVNALGLRLIFQPGPCRRPALRHGDDHAARRLYGSIVGMMFLFIFLRFWLRSWRPFSPSDDAIAASRLITSPISSSRVPIWLRPPP